LGSARGAGRVQTWRHANMPHTSGTQANHSYGN